MLVLSRKVDEKIMIGDDISLTVVRIDANRVRIGVSAPRDVRILRGELAGQEIVEGEFELSDREFAFAHPQPVHESAARPDRDDTDEGPAEPTAEAPLQNIPPAKRTAKTGQRPQSDADAALKAAPRAGSAAPQVFTGSVSSDGHSVKLNSAVASVRSAPLAGFVSAT
ncbi:carbon storage regulator [Roseiconus nitratireducens]|uniref:Translational regulator CsrA n=1 Tax=Roseiconus nitratireducens TaxID=2605748 RepID=A0A5M6CKD3_9BACT|nr:carbon storage regulator [Roseiconus nitratireducens]KAA5535678.1 carbon storage regulator [Roseiconus nitratireducens]